MREYETIYILKPEIDDDTAVDFINKMKGLVEKNGGQHVQVTNLGRRKIAWERDRHQKGMFVQHRYLGQSGIVKEYERSLKLAEDCILRQTVVRRKAVDPSSVAAEADTIKPPVTKEPVVRRDDRYGDRGGRDRDGGGYRSRDRDDRDDRDDRGPRGPREDRGPRHLSDDEALDG